MLDELHASKGLYDIFIHFHYSLLGITDILYNPVAVLRHQLKTESYCICSAEIYGRV
jgi:hypothetical protein